MSRAHSDLAILREQLATWLCDDALPLWWTVGADHRGGGFHEAIDHIGEPVLGDRRARVQARQIFTYATANGLGWAGPSRTAMDHGLDYYIGRYRRADGLFSNALTAESRPIDAQPHLYEQAFALLALATATGAGGKESTLLPVAEALLENLSTHRRSAAGGFTSFVDDDFQQSDPHMHLFEAAMAWEQVSDDPRWRRLADEIAELSLARFMTRGRSLILEYFDPSWSPAAGEKGRLAWPGHQFEWAGLLERWALARGRPDVRVVARRLYKTGMDHGIDPARGVAVYELLDDLSVHDSKARLWSQTEWLKAAVILARSETDDEQRERYVTDAIQAAKALLLYFETPVRGLWRDKLLGDGTWIDEPAPASSFYHVIDALRVLAAWSPDGGARGAV